MVAGSIAMNIVENDFFITIMPFPFILYINH